MTRRQFDQKSVKISFNESPDEQEFNYDWDINFSSDEDIFLKGKSEILWSRTRDLFDYPDSSQSFSDFTERTVSSCSWNNDEFDMKSSSKVYASLEAIDSALYERVKTPFLTDSLFQECSDWAEKFPYFRIKGQQISSVGSENFSSYLSNSSNMSFEVGNLSSCLHVEGKKLPIHFASKLKGIVLDNMSDNNVPTPAEENIDEKESNGEYFALHNSDLPIDNYQVPISDSSKIHSTIKLLQEKVLDKVVSEMWPSVLAFLEKLDDRKSSNINNDLQLPPITVSNEHKRTLCLKRPNTEGSGFSTEFPKLDSILTVSSKVLQKRELGCSSRAARPNSEMSVNPRVSSKSMKSIYHHRENAQINSDYYSVKGPKNDRESEGLCIVLPALEENFQDSSNVLRGFHIEPERKDSTNKNIQPTKNELEKNNSTRENDYFLPPIEDKNYLPSHVNLTKNLFTFYGSPVMRDKSSYPDSAKYTKTNSRPNTSVSKKIVKNNEVIQQLPVSNGLYITAKSMSKTSNLYRERNSDVNIVDNETVEESKEKSVTLFPIVTSLTPQEDKNNVIKKGLLHAFLGRKR